MNGNWSKIDPEGPGLHAPKRSGDVGWDLEAAKEIVIMPGEARDIPTNVRLEIPDGLWAEIRARSSISRRGLQVDAGTIDTGYRGPLFALVRNMKAVRPNELFKYAISNGEHQVFFRPFKYYMDWRQKNAVTIKRGDRIAQVVFHHTPPIKMTEVSKINDDTDRGSNGFGSTGR